MSKALTHASLFSGIGGFDLAAQWAGFENVFHCEFDPVKRTDLLTNFPNTISYGDIQEVDFREYADKITVLSGGFPCQDISRAKRDGKGQKGLDGKRSGLWKQMVRAIYEIRPRFVVSENVSDLLHINSGRDFAIILDSLARMGYNAEWRVCYASEVGAPHHRARVYLVAYSSCIRLHEMFSFFSNVAKTTASKPWEFNGATISLARAGYWNSEPPILCVDDGVSSKLVRRQLHGYGNAVVPQIAYEIFKEIKIIDHE